MRNFFLCAILFLFAMHYTLHAQAADSSLYAGGKALEFQIGSNFSLTTFDGSTISYESFLSCEHSLRFGLSVNWNENNQSGDNKTNNADIYSVKVNAYYMWYMPPKNSVYFYYGVGPVFAYSYTKYVYDEQNIDLVNGNSFSTDLRVDKSLSVGVGGACGVEVFVTKAIAISAEYNGFALYSHGVEDRSTSSTFTNVFRVDNSTQISDSYVFTSTARLGLIVHF